MLKSFSIEFLNSYYNIFFLLYYSDEEIRYLVVMCFFSQFIFHPAGYNKNKNSEFLRFRVAAFYY